MANQSSNDKKKKGANAVPPRVIDIVNAYHSSADALGSYTGVTDESLGRPRKVTDGKLYLKVEEVPVQDQDDL